jgi:hypothetical protein
MTQIRFIFVIIAITAVLVFTVHVRTTSNRAFHKLRVANLTQKRLNQTLRQKQLQIESMINPAAISEQLEQVNPSK